MITADYHVHSNFSDGKHDPADVVASAAERGMTELGFSDHGYADCDLDCCIPKARREEYVRTILGLREANRGKLNIICGMEQDYYSITPPEGVAYVIGSVHYLRHGDDYRSVDYKPEAITDMAENWFGGDYLAVTEDYFARVSEIYEVTHCDVIGHFDLIAKLNTKYPFFDENDPRYTAAWQKAADILLKTGKPFEINTGAISRGYRTVPYPADPMCRYIADRGGKFLISSDSHDRNTLCFRFDRVEAYVRRCGFTLVSSPLDGKL